MGKKPGQQEVEYKEKSGTAWSHSYLNQKPWHPLSYPNQRRKWIAEQQNAQKARKAEEVAHEFSQQQEFFRQTAEMSKKEKEKVENLQAVGFMYMRPPGYNAESARAAEIADERKMLGLDAPPPPPKPSQDAALVDASQGEAGVAEPEVKKKRRVKDVFGRNVATEEEFAVLKDAPKLDTGVAGRVKPFAVEIRNVKCAKCGGFGHQSGDRECPMKDVITPMEMERLKRNDPLNAIIAQATGDEPFKWELKNQPGAMSPARGGFRPDDPNQQILADEDIYDEYGGFLAGVGDGDASDEDRKLAMPDILASLTKEQRKELAALRVDEKKWKKEDRRKNKRKKKKRKPRIDESSDDDKKKRRKPRSDESSDDDKKKKRKPRSDESSDEDKKKKRKPRSDDSSDEEQHRHRHRSNHTKPKKRRKHQNGSSSESDRAGTASEPSRKIENESRHRHRSRDRDRERQVARDGALDEIYDSFKRQRRRDHRERRYDDLPQ